MSAAQQDTYGNQSWGSSPWGGAQPGGWNQGAPPWGARWAPPFWHPAGMSRPVAIAFTILGFFFWWPVGLAILFYMIGSGRMGCYSRRRQAYQAQNGGSPPWSSWKNWACGPSGNRCQVPPAATMRSDECQSAETLPPSWRMSRRNSARSLSACALPSDKAEFDQFHDRPAATTRQLARRRTNSRDAYS